MTTPTPAWFAGHPDTPTWCPVQRRRPGRKHTQSDPDPPPPSGILKLKPNGAFVYIPTTVGTVTFTYRVTDSSGATDDATVTITTTERSRR